MLFLPFAEILTESVGWSEHDMSCRSGATAGFLSHVVTAAICQETKSSRNFNNRENTPIFSLCVYVNILLFILVSSEVMFENCLYVFYLSTCNDAYFGLFRAFKCQ